MSTTRNLTALVLAVMLAAPSAASAFVVDFSAGLKGLGGANLWTEPTDTLGSGLGYRGDAGGYGFGGGLYGEVRLVKLVGLELGLLFDKSNLWRNVDINTGGMQIPVKEEVSATFLRVPILAKAILPLGIVRFSAGVGPEIVIGQSSDESIEVPDYVTLRSQPDFKTKTETSTHIAIDLGAVFDIAGIVEIPISLRASKNLSQGTAWSDRVEADIVGSTLRGYTVTVQNTWDFRLLVGVGYVF